MKAVLAQAIVQLGTSKMPGDFRASPAAPVETPTEKPATRPPPAPVKPDRELPVQPDPRRTDDPSKRPGRRPCVPSRCPAK